MRPTITLTTDFGTVDGYVGEMKGVLVTLVPEANVVDITHDIPPQDVERGRLTLARVWRRFPVGTVHVVVVDPGVGSPRAALAVESHGRFLVGPDNGVLSPALLLPGARAVSLPTPRGSSATFHGRDVFAPAAAALASGESIEALGHPFASAVVRHTPQPTRRDDGAIVGEVLFVDRFGNAVTNLIGARGGVLDLDGRRVPVRRTYAEVPSGELTAVVGSTGFIELAVRDGSAAELLGVRRGSAVVLSRG